MSECSTSKEWFYSPKIFESGHITCIYRFNPIQSAKEKKINLSSVVTWKKASHWICEELTGVCKESIASWFNMRLSAYVVCIQLYTEHSEQFRDSQRIVLTPCDFHGWQWLSDSNLFMTCNFNLVLSHIFIMLYYYTQVAMSLLSELNLVRYQVEISHRSLDRNSVQCCWDSHSGLLLTELFHHYQGE